MRKMSNGNNGFSSKAVYGVMVVAVLTVLGLSSLMTGCALAEETVSEDIRIAAVSAETSKRVNYYARKMVGLSAKDYFDASCRLEEKEGIDFAELVDVRVEELKAAQQTGAATPEVQAQTMTDSSASVQGDNVKLAVLKDDPNDVRVVAQTQTGADDTGSETTTKVAVAVQTTTGKPETPTPVEDKTNVQTEADVVPAVETTPVQPEAAVVAEKSEATTPAAPRTVVTKTESSSFAQLESDDETGDGTGFPELEEHEANFSALQTLRHQTVDEGLRLILATVADGKTIKGDKKYAVVGGKLFVTVRDINGHAEGAPVNIPARGTKVAPKEIVDGVSCVTTITRRVARPNGKLITVALNLAIDAHGGAKLYNHGVGNVREFADSRNASFEAMSTADYFDREFSYGQGVNDPSYFCAIAVKDGKVYAIKFDDNGNELNRVLVNEEGLVDAISIANTLAKNHPDFFVTGSDGLYPSLADALRKTSATKPAKAPAKKTSAKKSTKK